ncbi:MAG: fumarate reductase subunit C [Actinomycetota bacterium]
MTDIPERGPLRAEERRYPVYVRRPSRTWWLRTGAYRRFALREATAVFAGAFSVILLLFLSALSRGPQAYEAFLRWVRLPGIVALSAVILVATVYHAGTWLRLTSHILVVRLGPRVVPRKVVTGGLVALWVIVSAVVAYFTVWS